MVKSVERTHLDRSPVSFLTIPDILLSLCRFYNDLGKETHMTMRRNIFVFCLVIGLVLSGLIASMALAGDVPRMSKENLKSRLGSPDVVVLDVRAEGDWRPSDKKIKGAVREDPTDVESWIKDHPKDKTIVLYCA